MRTQIISFQMVTSTDQKQPIPPHEFNFSLSIPLQCCNRHPAVDDFTSQPRWPAQREHGRHPLMTNMNPEWLLAKPLSFNPNLTYLLSYRSGDINHHAETQTWLRSRIRLLPDLLHQDPRIQYNGNPCEFFMCPVLRQSNQKRFLSVSLSESLFKQSLLDESALIKQVIYFFGNKQADVNKIQSSQREIE